MNDTTLAAPPLASRLSNLAPYFLSVLRIIAAFMFLQSGTMKLFAWPIGMPPDNSTGNYVKIVQRVPVRIRVDGDRRELDLLKVGMNMNVYVPKERHHG